MGTKRLRESEEEMEVASIPGKWGELISDLLALIFSKLPVRERVTVIRWVCKSWAQALTESLCWQDIDLLPWINMDDRQLRSPQLADRPERMVRKLVPRSSGTLRTLCVYGLESHSVFIFIAEKMLEELYRCMYLHLLDHDPPIYDDEAMAIASTMPNLKILDIGGHSISTEGVLMILGACSKLQVLCVWHCWNVQAQDLGLTKNRFPKLAIWGPQPTDSFILLGYHPLEPSVMLQYYLEF